MYQYYKNENYNNEYPPATFYIESNIKRFINSISIFNLPKNIYDKKNNTEEEDSFQLNKRREQHESKNSPCDSCKRRVYISR